MFQCVAGDASIQNLTAKGSITQVTITASLALQCQRERNHVKNKIIMLNQIINNFNYSKRK